MEYGLSPAVPFKLEQMDSRLSIRDHFPGTSDDEAEPELEKHEIFRLKDEDDAGGVVGSGGPEPLASSGPSESPAMMVKKKEEAESKGRPVLLFRPFVTSSYHSCLISTIPPSLLRIRDLFSPQPSPQGLPITHRKPQHSSSLIESSRKRRVGNWNMVD